MKRAPRQRMREIKVPNMIRCLSSGSLLGSILWRISSRLSCARRRVERGVASSWCMWSARERARTSSTSDVTRLTTNCLVIGSAPHDHHCAASETTLLPPPEVSLVVALASPITFLMDSMTSAAWPLMCVLLRLTREWGKRRNKNTLTLLVWS